MDATFFELPLERDLYVPKKCLRPPRDLLRVLITEAGSKIAHNLIYQLCSGNVFGEDKDIIIHLINARGGLHHKSIILELEHCGFNACKDFVVSSSPEIAFNDVDVVIAIATYEEIPGKTLSSAMVHQLIKARQLAVHVQQFAKKDVKIVFTGPSTKAVTYLLGAFQKFAPKIPPCNVSSVTMLDVTISKALLAAKLKTTTDKIKNVIVWATTFPDVHNATVRMYPADDKGKWEMKDVPIAEAIQDDLWLFTTFPMAIYNRLMTPDLLKYGKAVAQSVVKHLEYLFKGSNKFDEIPSMSVISPPTKIYGVPPDYGFSFPMETNNGTWKILEGIKYDTATHLNMLRSIFNLSHSEIVNSTMKVVSYMLDYEATEKKIVQLHNHHFIEEVIEARNWITRYFVTPSPAEKITKTWNRLRESKKSIAWDDESSFMKKRLVVEKSALTFSAEKKTKKLADRRIRQKSHPSAETDLASILKEISEKI